MVNALPLSRLGCVRKIYLFTTSSRNFSIPTRHSRHLPPSACLSIDHLKDISQEVLSSSPGSLIPYNKSERDDAFHAWGVADTTIQKVEWLIRGYSAQVLNTQMQKEYAVKSNEDPSESIKCILDLIQKVETEGDIYMKLRNEMRSQLNLNQKSEQDKFFDEYGDQETDTDSQNFPEIDRVFASPGQTIGMFDTLLDTISMATDSNTPVMVGNIFDRINKRFELDGGMAFNVNPNTVPTQMTYNAALRAIANGDNTGEKTRDHALMHAFDIFHLAKSAEKKKCINAATYNYMVQIIAKYVPPSEMCGNLANAFWNLAKEDRVVDSNLMRTMESVNCGGFEKYETFIDKNISNKDIEDIPKAWKVFEKSLRYNEEDNTY